MYPTNSYVATSVPWDIQEPRAVADPVLPVRHISWALAPNGLQPPGAVTAFVS